LHKFSWSSGKLPLSGAVGMNVFWLNVIDDIAEITVRFSEVLD